MSTVNKRVLQEVAGQQQQMSALTPDKIREIAPKAEEPDPQPLSLKERAKLENVLYIEPKRILVRAAANEKLPEKLRAQHARDWEYVKGMFENYEMIGASVTFSLKLYPGDHFCSWEIPANIPVYVPRMVAKHLEETMVYHSFSYLEKPQQQCSVDDFTHNFAPMGTHYRGKFRAIGVFA